VERKGTLIDGYGNLNLKNSLKFKLKLKSEKFVEF
jgi:hypothetical protein